MDAKPQGASLVVVKSSGLGRAIVTSRALAGGSA